MIISVVLTALLFGCVHPSFVSGFPLDNPTATMEAFEKYIRDGELREDMDGYSCSSGLLGADGVSCKLTVDNLVLMGLTYPLSHKAVIAEYFIKDSVKEDGYSAIAVKLDDVGHCSINGMARTDRKSGKDLAAGLKCLNIGSPGGVISKANEFIARGNIRSIDIRDNATRIEHRVADEYINNIIRKRIPSNISLNDLILSRVEYWHCKHPEVVYCLKPTLYRTTSDRVEYCSVYIGIDEKRDCIFDGIHIGCANGFNFKEETDEVAHWEQSELDDIYETVFRHMFNNADKPEQNIKIIFLAVKDHDPLSDIFINRFKNEPITVSSPFNEIDVSGKDCADGACPTIRQDGILYYIKGVERFDETHAFINYFVYHTAQDRSTQGDPESICILEKKDNKWHVVKVSKKWYEG